MKKAFGVSKKILDIFISCEEDVIIIRVERFSVELSDEQKSIVNKAINLINQYDSKKAGDLAYLFSRNKIQYNGEIKHIAEAIPYCRVIILGQSSEIDNLVEIKKLRDKSNISEIKDMEERLGLVFLASILVHEHYHAYWGMNEENAYTQEILFLKCCYENELISDRLKEKIKERALIRQQEYCENHHGVISIFK